MENLNAEQVKKALECCISESAESCVECPNYNAGKKLLCYECMETVMRQGLDLIKSQEQRIDELWKIAEFYRKEAERLVQAPTAKGYRKQEDVLQELNDEVVKKYMDERSVFLEERKNVGEGEGAAFWYIQGRIDGMEWVKDTVRFTKNKMIDQIAKEMLEGGDGIQDN